MKDSSVCPEKNEIARLRTALKGCIRFDKTPAYEYHGKNSLDLYGNKPPAAERWMSPYEWAKQALDTSGTKD